MWHRWRHECRSRAAATTCRKAYAAAVPLRLADRPLRAGAAAVQLLGCVARDADAIARTDSVQPGVPQGRAHGRGGRHQVEGDGDPGHVLAAAGLWQVE